MDKILELVCKAHPTTDVAINASVLVPGKGILVHYQTGDGTDSIPFEHRAGFVQFINGEWVFRSIA